MFVYIYLQLCNICSISQVLQEEMKDHTVSHDWIHKSLCTVHHEDHKWRGENFQAGVSGVLSANSVWRKEGATAAPYSPSFFFLKVGNFPKNTNAATHYRQMSSFKKWQFLYVPDLNMYFIVPTFKFKSKIKEK